MAIQIQLRRDTAANWTTEAPTLFQGELGLETDTGQMKMGDGSTTWSGLDYMESTGVTDHGDLTGRDDDDHTQYHNNTRGDVRYYTKTELNAGQLDNQYYTETELNAGQLDNQYYTETELDAGQLDNRYFRENEHLNSSAGAGDAGKPVKLDAAGDVNISMIKMDDIDHGNISGKDDDDHTQYHTNTRGDARYYTQSEVDALTWVESDITDLDKYTEAEITTISGNIVDQLHTRSHTVTSTSDHTAGNHKIFYSNGSGVLTELTHGTNEHVLTSNGATSAPSWQAAPPGSYSSRMYAKRSTTQSIAHATVTDVQYNTEVFDGLGEYDNTTYRFTPGTTGYYFVTASIALGAATWAANEYARFTLTKNNSETSTHLDSWYAPGTTSGMTLYLNGTALIYLLDTDYIKIMVIHTQGAAVNIAAAGDNNYFMVHRLS